MPRVVGVLCLVLAVMATATAAVEAPRTPTELNWTSRPVLFSHQIHFGALGGDAATQCASCHHPVEGDIPYKTCATHDCHDNLDKRDTSPRSYYLAIHKNKKEKYWSCVSCHEQRAGEDVEAIKKMVGCNASVCHSF
ncbi:MAG: cytochrome c class III [Candidatus Desulfovibrio kirbyi]|jgi:hypothetical protein|uniref:Cytochrome c class III n=1 Tax=Candidatus Desulfovibrio kirbyi TaxID=2696086 RepID=A0A6L2R712_9BACT|nr:cytochrome c3 family protein [Desulfovibrio sp.]GFH63277.1 MAG: cytochrome c class III [Candidatus Desulfovibrio kirbyi]